MFCHLKTIILILSFLLSLIHHFMCSFLPHGWAHPAKNTTKTYSITYSCFQSFSNFTSLCVMWIFVVVVVSLRMPVEQEMAPSPSGWRVSPAVTKRSPVLALLFLICR